MFVIETTEGRQIGYNIYKIFVFFYEEILLLVLYGKIKNLLI